MITPSGDRRSVILLLGLAAIVALLIVPSVIKPSSKASTTTPAATSPIHSRENNLGAKHTPPRPSTAAAAKGLASDTPSSIDLSAPSDSEYGPAFDTNTRDKFEAWITRNREEWSEADDQLRECAERIYLKGLSWTPDGAVNACLNQFEFDESD